MNKQKAKPKASKEVRKDTVTPAGRKPTAENIGAQGDFGGE